MPAQRIERAFFDMGLMFRRMMWSEQPIYIENTRIITKRKPGDGQLQANFLHHLTFHHISSPNSQFVDNWREEDHECFSVDERWSLLDWHVAFVVIFQRAFQVKLLKYYPYAAAIGMTMGFCAFIVDLALEILNSWKFNTVKNVIRNAGGFWAPYIAFLFFTMGFSALSGSIVSFIAPMAAGSGIPEVKSYLNGVHIKGTLCKKYDTYLCGHSSRTGPKWRSFTWLAVACPHCFMEYRLWLIFWSARLYVLHPTFFFKHSLGD